jgi:hypothetical protein
MMIPEYVRFYGGSVSDCLNEYARTFFSMVGAMNRIKADEMLTDITSVGAGMSGKDASGLVDQLKQQSKGLSGIVEEVRLVKKVSKK